MQDDDDARCDALPPQPRDAALAFGTRVEYFPRNVRLRVISRFRIGGHYYYFS